MKISTKFSLPIQIGIIVMLALQALLIFIAIKAQQESARLSFAEANSVLGWIMTIIFIGSIITNLTSYINRTRQLDKTIDEEKRKQIFISSTLVRNATLQLISLVAILFFSISNNLYYFFFVVLSTIWQVKIYPSKTTMSNILTPKEEKMEISEKIDEQENPAINVVEKGE